MSTRSIRAILGPDTMSVVEIMLFEVDPGNYEKIGSELHSTKTLCTTQCLRTKHTVCLLDIPAFMLPRDILTYFTAHLEHFVSFRVLRHFNNPENYLGIIEMVSEEAAATLIHEYKDQVMTTLTPDKPTICRLVQVQEIIRDSVKKEEKEESEEWNQEQAQEQETGIEMQTEGEIEGQGQEGIERPEPFKRRSSSQGSSSSSSSLHYLSENCPLCLEPLMETETEIENENNTDADADAKNDMEATTVGSTVGSTITAITTKMKTRSKPRRVFRTACNHDFHIDCIRRLSSPLCPVCRFQHDSASSSLSACGAYFNVYNYISDYA